MPRRVLIKVRVGTAAEWAASPTIPALGEPCYATDTGMLKIGDGVNVWSAINFEFQAT